MSASIQLLSFLYSSIYGLIFSLLTIYNYKITNKLKPIIKNSITSIFVLDMIVIYSLIMFYINNGYFHIYYLGTTAISFLLGLLLYKKHSKIVVNRLLSKLKK